MKHIETKEKVKVGDIFIDGNRKWEVNGKHNNVIGKFLCIDPGFFQRYIVYFVPKDQQSHSIVCRNFCSCGASNITSSYNQWKQINLNDGRYQGDLNENNIPHGNGVMSYDNGNKYEGDWMNGKYNGKGVLIDKIKNRILDGNWNNGKFDEREEKILHEFYCPISQEVMKNPVTTKCGHSFDKESLDKHINLGNLLCPLCNQKLIIDEPYILNLSLKNIISEFTERCLFE